DRIAVAHLIAFLDEDLRHPPGIRSDDRDLHLHGLDDHQRVPLPDLVSDLDEDLPDGSRHLAFHGDFRHVFASISDNRPTEPRPRKARGASERDATFSVDTARRLALVVSSTTTIIARGESGDEEFHNLRGADRRGPD